MEEACRYSERPLAFLARYVRRRPVAHAAIATAVVAAVGCSVGAQYGVKVLVDILAGGLYVGTHARDAWLGFLLLATLIAADNLLWRVASWIASYTFVAVTGDLPRSNVCDRARKAVEGAQAACSARAACLLRTFSTAFVQPAIFAATALSLMSICLLRSFSTAFRQVPRAAMRSFQSVSTDMGVTGE